MSLVDSGYRWPAMDTTSGPSTPAPDPRPGPGTIGELVQRLEGMQDAMSAADGRQHFLRVYTNTTRAVGEELRTASLGGFLDPPWVERWDLAFAGLYTAAFDAWMRGESTTPGPWAVAFAAARDRPTDPPLRHVLFGINAHVNYDLPQALLSVITDQQFDDPMVSERRRRDHEHIDRVLASRVGEEDRALPGSRTFTDRLLTPLNRQGTKRFLKEARQKVWRNADALSKARRIGPDAYGARLRELEKLSADRVTDLVAPGQVILKLARDGFGVVLSGA